MTRELVFKRLTTHGISLLLLQKSRNLKCSLFNVHFSTRSCPVRSDDFDLRYNENKAESNAWPNEGAMEGSTHILEKLKQTGKLVQSSTVSLQTNLKRG